MIYSTLKRLRVKADKMRRQRFKQLFLRIFTIGITIKLLALMPLEIAQPSSSDFEYDSFTQWCVNRNKISSSAQKTVAVLLETAKSSNCEIANQKLVRVSDLRLNFKEIVDVRPISSLTNLRTLVLQNNQITDISSLRSLTNLYALDLEKNKIADISPLSSLTNLAYLNLNNNQITDLNSLRSLAKLTVLHLSNNQFRDSSVLSSFTNLRTLDLSNNKITDISFIQSIANLTDLTLENNQITDISSLRSLNNLKTLTLNNNQITDISPLRSLSKLMLLYLSNNQITDINSLSGLTDLTYLTLDNNQITDISPLRSLTKLALIHYQGDIITSNIANAQPLDRQTNDETPQTHQKTDFVTQVDKTAKEVTVLINSKNNGNGSGTLVAREKDIYYVLTAKHVVKNPDTYTLITPDGQQHQLDPRQSKLLEEVDLAVVQFTSSKSYSIATLGDYSLYIPKPNREQKPQRLLTAGLVQKEDETAFRTKDIYSLSQEGYGLVYTNQSLGGMSGGPVLDSRGYVIGINAAAENELETTQDGQTVEISLGLSLGVPIKTFVSLIEQTQIKPQSLQIETTAPPQLTVFEVDSLKKRLLIAKAPGNNANAVEWVNYGNQLWRFKQFAEAAIAFERAISLQSDLYQAYYGKGLALLAVTDRYSDALAAMKKVTQLAPKFAAAWRMQGAILMQLERYPESLAAYERAIEIDPEDFTLYYFQGIVFSQLERFNEAVASYSQAIDLQQGNPWIYMSRQIAYGQLGETEKEIADFEKATQLFCQQRNPACQQMQKMLRFYQRQNH
jgi:Leucine-rich repeat (LRR) protein/Flp pilus assembly protein TadD